MRRLFQAGTGSLYSLSPECFRLPFVRITCSFPPLNGAPRQRPLLPCLLRWSTSNERKRDSVHTKTKKKWRISREWIWELNFSAWVGNTRYVLLFWRTLCISVSQRNTSFCIGTRTSFLQNSINVFHLYMKANGWQMSPTLEFLFTRYSAAIHCLCQKSGLGFLGMLFTPR